MGVRRSSYGKQLVTNISKLSSICFLLISINDITSKIPDKIIKRNIRSILTILQDHNKTVLLSTIPPTLNNAHKQNIRNINVYLQSFHNPPSVQTIYFHRLFPPYTSINKQLYEQYYYNGRPDFIHLSPAAFFALIRMVQSAVTAPPALLCRRPDSTLLPYTAPVAATLPSAGPLPDDLQHPIAETPSANVS